MCGNSHLKFQSRGWDAKVIGDSPFLGWSHMPSQFVLMVELRLLIHFEHIIKSLCPFLNIILSFTILIHVFTQEEWSYEAPILLWLYWTLRGPICSNNIHMLSCDRCLMTISGWVYGVDGGSLGTIHSRYHWLAHCKNYNLRNFMEHGTHALP